MRIINLEEFRKLPEGTVFCKYEPQIFSDLSIKGETLDSDFIAASLVGNIESTSSDDMSDKLDRYEQTGESFELDMQSYARDGLFEEKQLFAVYEPTDIEKLIHVLEQSLYYDTRKAEITSRGSNTHFNGRVYRVKK